ncbi:hypothetical protein IPM65_05790 [Candidatus Roizmanbacteria bacterium]|nr:MAG: hypothetical protein IPM65_05790 [Candidatus Roizmanbacteria bacterium]
MENRLFVPIEELLKERGLNEADISLHKASGTDLQELLQADIFSHHSAYRNVPSQQDLFDAGQHWSDWE